MCGQKYDSAHLVLNFFAIRVGRGSCVVSGLLWCSTQLILTYLASIICILDIVFELLYIVYLFACFFHYGPFSVLCGWIGIHFPGFITRDVAVVQPLSYLNHKIIHHQKEHLMFSPYPSSTALPSVFVFLTFCPLH